MPTILHSDLNAFYASVETLYQPELKSVPVAVCGDPQARHGIILTKNQLAKEHGVQTGEAIWEAKQKCPALVLIRSDMDKYVRFAQRMRAIYSDYTDRVEPFGMDEAWLDVTGDNGPLVADEIRKRAREELGLTASIGVADNKIFAKLGSDMQKPDATTVITPENFRTKVWPLPVSELLYVGPATCQKLTARGIVTIGHLANCNPSILRTLLGKAGDMLHTFANGLDRTPVARTDVSLPAKSIGNSTTTSRDIQSEEDAKWVLMMLCELIGQRMRKQGLQGREVCLWIRDANMTGYEKHTCLPVPTDIDGELLACGMELLRTGYGWAQPIRGLGLRISKLTHAGDGQQITFFDDPRRDKQRDLEKAIDTLRGRFGDDCIRRAYLLTKDLQNLTEPIHKEYKPFECVRQG